MTRERKARHPPEPELARAPGLTGFWARRIFSFLGVVPLGTYVIWHLYNNAFAFRGPEAFDGRLAKVLDSPLYQPLVWLLVYVPFLVHSFVGLVITWKSEPNVARVPALRNWKYLLQRISAVGVLLFVPAHVYKAKIAPWLAGQDAGFAHMHEGMLEPVTLAVYVLGMLGVCFHLANGLWLAGITWGLFVGPNGQRRGERLSILFGLVLLGISLAIVFVLRRG